jgi:hypothetical protein
MARCGRRRSAILFCRGAMTTTPKTRSRRRSCAAAAIIRGQHVGRDTLANRRRVAARWRSIALKQSMQLLRGVVRRRQPSALRLSVQAERRRCRCDPAAPFDGVASSSRLASNLVAATQLGPCCKCAKRKIHFATQHSPLERTFFLTSLSASRLRALTSAFLHPSCRRRDLSGSLWEHS